MMAFSPCFHKLICSGINELVDEVFPPLHSNTEHDVREEYNDFSHWRLPVSIPQRGLDDPELVDQYSFGNVRAINEEVPTAGHLAKSLLGD